jgi:hypothetical protein
MCRRPVAETRRPVTDPRSRRLRRSGMAAGAALVAMAAALPASAGAAATLTVVPNLLGSVTVEPAGTPVAGTQAPTTCTGPPIQPSQCTWEYPPGTAVTLTSVPDVNAGTLVSWSDVDCPKEPVCTLTLEEGPTTVGVTYSAMRLAIREPQDSTITGSAGGVDLSCPGQCEADVPFGTSVTLTGQPNAGKAGPIHWYRGCDEGYDHIGPTCTVAVTMNPWWISADVEGGSTPGIPPAIGVTFKVRKRGNGTVSGDKLSCGATCAGSYDDGTRVNLTAVPDRGWRFDHWDGGCGTSATCRLIAGPTTSVRAVFAAAAAPPPPAPGKPLLSGVTARQTGRGRTRRVVVAFTLARRAVVAVGLTRSGSRVRVASRSATLGAGRRQLSLAVPRRWRAGSYRVSVRAVSGGRRMTATAGVRLRR